MKSSPMSLFEEFIKEAFGSQYVIPVYQRNYTWKKNKQVKQLLIDIENILRVKQRNTLLELLFTILSIPISWLENVKSLMVSNV